MPVIANSQKVKGIAIFDLSFREKFIYELSSNIGITIGPKKSQFGLLVGYRQHIFKLI